MTLGVEAWWLQGPTRRGKVRDIYDRGEYLVMIASDRISAFDWVLTAPIPDKGRVLTQLSAFWFDFLGEPHHLLSTDVAFLNRAGAPQLPEDLRAFWSGRVMITKPARVIPFECVVRGYLAGSGWKEYRATGAIQDHALPAGYEEAARLQEPIFTPATKAESGHDENVPFSVMVSALGAETATTLRDRSIAVYQRAAAYAESRGILLADTKFEWGHDRVTGELLLIDEVLTPDSSRYWDAARYAPGRSPASFDKQFVRDWLETSDWDKASPPPLLPTDVVAFTRAQYIIAYERLTGQTFPWAGENRA